MASVHMGTKHYPNFTGIFSLHPRLALGRVVRERPWAIALTLITVFAVLSGLKQVWRETGNVTYSNWFTQRMSDPGIDDALILYPLVYLGGIALLSGFYWVVSWIFRSRGPYSGLFAGLGFALLPLIIASLFMELPPVSSIFSAAGIFGSVLFLLLVFAICAWSGTLTAIVIRENHGLTSEGAVLVMLSPVIIMITWILVLPMVIVIMLFVLDYFLRLFGDAGLISAEQAEQVGSLMESILDAL